MRYLFKSKSLTFFVIAAFLVGGFFVANSARAYTGDFKAFDGVAIGTNSYTVSSGITATYTSGTGTEIDPVKLTLTGYAPIVTPWFGPTWTTYNYVTVGIKLPDGFSGTTVYQTGIIRNDSPYNGVSYKMSTIGDGSTPLATSGAAVGYLDFSFAANSTNTKKDGLVKLQVIWNAGSAPEYFTININDLQTSPVFIDTSKNGTFDSGEPSFNTIQAAVSAAASGDMINVAAGTYTEQINVGDQYNLTKWLIFRGSNTGLSAGSVPVTRNSETIINGGFRLWGGSSVIDGFTIQGGFIMSGAAHSGIVVGSANGGSPNVTIENNIIQGCSGNQSNGIEVVAGSTNLQILNNEIFNNWRGLYLNNTSGITISGNKIHANNGVGVGIGSSGLSNFTLTNNIIADHTAEGWGMDNVGVNVLAHHNSFIGNTLSVAWYPYPDNGNKIDATNNWWGDASGPKNTTTNPSATGSNVSDNVNYKPWCTDSGCTTLSSTANVSNLNDLKTALANTDVSTINITADIAAIPATLVVSVGHAVTINGGSHTLTFTGLENVVGNVDDGFMIQAPTTINDLTVDAGLVTPTSWVGTYAIQVFNTTATLNNVTAKNGNGGILGNNSPITLTGAINVSGNGFGGIESSGASASLNVSGFSWTNTSEAYGEPTVWEDGTSGTTVINYEAFPRIIKGGQYQYYLTAGNAVDPAATLATAKITAKGDLDSYVSLSAYRPAEQTNVTDAIDTGKTAIDGAGTLGDVATALANAKSAIDPIKTDATLTAEEAAATLVTAKTTAKGVLTTALGTYTEGNYTASNWTTLTGFKTTGDTAIGVATNLAGVSSAQSAATDGMVSVTPLEVNQTKIEGTDSNGNGLATIDATTPEVVISSLTQPVIITVETSNATLDLTDLITSGAGTLPQMTITAGNASVEISDGTTVTAPGWNGIMSAPTAGTKSGTAPAGFSVGNTVIEMGSPDHTLNFSNAVKVTLTGVTGTVGYRPAGSTVWQTIATPCTSSDVSGILSGECSIPDGLGNTVIWTYHFTTFGGLNAVVTPTPSYGGGGGGYVQTTCTDVTYSEWGTVIFNGLQYRTILSQTPNSCSLSASQIVAESRTYVAPVEPVSAQITPVIETPAQTSTVTQQVLGVKKYADGTLLKGTNNKIYVVKGNTLQYISSLKELAKYKGPILKVDDATISSFAQTAVLGAKKYADGTLLKGTNNKIYVVKGDALQYISSLKELAKYRGPVLKVGDEVISSFSGAAVLGTKKYADGTLIKAKGDTKIYVIKDGKKVHIKSLTELKQYKGKTLTVDASELNNY